MRQKFLILGLIGGLGVASTDIFIPILPKLTDLYQVTPYLMSFTISIYFISCFFGSLSYIYISKFYSSQKINAVALLFFVLGSMMITIGEIYWIIFLGRVIQGLTFGISNTNIISSIRKIKSHDFAKSMSSYCIAAEFICFFAPISGVLLSEHIAWRAPFVLISIITLFLYIKSKNIMKSISIINENEAKQCNILIYDNKFWIYNFISLIMIGTGWSLISISPYFIEIDYGSAFVHSVLYTLYTLLYIMGSALTERELINKEKTNKYFILSLIVTVCMFISYFMTNEKIYFITGFLLFGCISGVMYGTILEKSLRNIPDNKINTATSVTVISRQISSAVFVVISSYLYSFGEQLSLSFGILMMFVVVALVTYDERGKKKEFQIHSYEIN